MKRDHKTSDGNETSSAIQAIDVVVLQFERASQRVDRVLISEWLDRHPELPRSALLESLLFVEWGMRRKRGDEYSIDEYLDQMSADRETVERSWREFHGADASTLGYLTIDLAQEAAARSKSPALISLGRFKDVQRLGSGGMGMVFTAFDPDRNTKVALKTIKDVSGESIYRFKREFRALADIAHPNLCPLYELLMIDGVWFITMPFIDGLDLVQHTRKFVSCDRLSRTEARSESVAPPTQVSHEFAETESQVQPSTVRSDFELDLETGRSLSERPQGYSSHRRHLSELCDERNVRDIFAQITRGIMALHQSGRLHRDLKPMNVIVDHSGRAIVLDFGLVSESQQPRAIGQVSEARDRLAEKPDSNVRFGPEGFVNVHINLTGGQMSRTVEGTPQYMAPEQATGAMELTPACDWYALGVMLFEVLTGERPFLGSRTEVVELKLKHDAPAPDERVHGIPADLSGLCVRLLHRDPKRRPNGSEILKVLTGKSDAETASGWADQRVPFVGRDHLLGSLASVMQSVRDGRPAIVRIHGRSGAGKSSIMQQFLGECRFPQELVLRGRCYEQESVPYKALDGIMDSLSAALAAMSIGSRRRYIPSHSAELARVFEVLQRFSEWSGTGKRLAASEPGELRRRAMAGLRDLLHRLSEDFLVIISIDDFQWGDLESAEILLELFGEASPPPVLLLISYREEYKLSSACLRKWLGSESRASGTTEIIDMPIGPLNEEESRLLAEELLPVDLEDRDSYLETIIRESSGNPFFVIELALAASEGRRLPLRMAGERQHVLDEVLWNRIRSLPADAQRLLETIAMAGQPTHMAVIYEAAGFEIRDPNILNRLRIDRLIRSSGPKLDSELEAYHDRIRETVLSHLPHASKVCHHRALAQTLERQGGADAETLAVHFLGAENHGRAGHYFTAAADKASESLAFDHAAGLYRQALTLLSPSPTEGAAIRARLGAALANAGRGEQAAIAYAAAAEHASPEDKLDLRRKSAYQYCISGHVDKGKAAITELLKSVGLSMTHSPSATIGSLLWNRALLYLRGLKVRPRSESQIHKNALEQLDLAWSAVAGITMFEVINGARLNTMGLRLAFRAGESKRLVRFLCWEAVQRMNAGGREKATGDRMMALAEELAKDLDDPYTLTMILFTQGVVDFLTGNWSRSISRLDAATSEFTRSCVGVHWELGTARIFTHYSMYWHGELAEYQRRVESVYRTAIGYGDFYTEFSLGTFDLPFIGLVADCPDETAKCLDTYRNRLHMDRYSLQDMFALVQSSNLDIYTDRPEQALQRMLSGWRELYHSLLLRAETIYTYCWETRARAAIACVEKGIGRTQARAEALKAIRALESRGIWRFSCMPYLLRAGLACADGDLRSSVSGLRQGIRRAEETRLQLHLHPAQWQLAKQLQALKARDFDESFGDDETDLVSSAKQWMAAEGVKNPERFCAFLLPGFVRTS